MRGSLLPRTAPRCDTVGRVTTMTTGATDYDDAGRITAVWNLKSDGSTVLSIFTYSYDDVYSAITHRRH